MKTFRTSLVVLVIATFLPASLFSQIRVLESAGKKVSTGAPTKIVIKIKGGGTMPIFMINATARGISSGGGSYYGESTTRVIDAPGAFELEGGSYDFKGGTSLFAPYFQINATGGTQEWLLTPGNDALGWVGILGCGFGLGFGLVMAPIGLILGDEYLPLGLIGIALLAVGLLCIPVIGGASGTAEMVKTTVGWQNTRPGWFNPACDPLLARSDGLNLSIPLIQMGF